MSISNLLYAAKEARNKAYAPYSRFKVGCALLCANGQVYTGCNIENASYSATLCAERVAFAQAISKGQKDFVAIAIVGGSTPCPPCGVCAQFISEFVEPNTFNVIMLENDAPKVVKFAKILPLAFGKDNIK